MHNPADILRHTAEEDTVAVESIHHTAAAAADIAVVHIAVVHIAVAHIAVVHIPVAHTAAAVVYYCFHPPFPITSKTIHLSSDHALEVLVVSNYPCFAHLDSHLTVAVLHSFVKMRSCSNRCSRFLDLSSCWRLLQLGDVPPLLHRTRRL